jgi:hypothetical protein
MKRSKRRIEHDRLNAIKSNINSIKSRCQLIIDKADEALENPEKWNVEEIEEYLNRMLLSCENIRGVEVE